MEKTKKIFCRACGHQVKKFIFKKIITDHLAQQWQLTPKFRQAFDLRESSLCPFCHNSARARALAKAILKVFPFKGTTSLSTWVEAATKQNLCIAEINYCGNLHPILARLPGLKLSQYCEVTPRARLANFLKGIHRENIMRLSYPDNSFDLVLHSEVLEHVPDPKKALAECRRVLTPEGVCLFTLPVIPNRKTICRTRIEKNAINYLRPPSFHGSGSPDNLVFWEFGGDFIKKNHLQIVYSQAKILNFVFAIRKNFSHHP